MSDNANANANNEGPGGGVVQKDGIEFETANPNLAKAVPSDSATQASEATPDEDASGDQYTGSYPDVVVGSDSATTGTTWGVPQEEGGEQVYTPEGWKAEGDEEGDARPTRNNPGNEDEK